MYVHGHICLHNNNMCVCVCVCAYNIYIYIDTHTHTLPCALLRRTKCRVRCQWQDSHSESRLGRRGNSETTRGDGTRSGERAAGELIRRRSGCGCTERARLQDGDSLVLHISRVQAHAALAAVLDDGSFMTWGGAHDGGDSSAVQDRLKNVQQIQANGRAIQPLFLPMDLS